jgi:exopolyphosphatase/guanosine-5'-triphosphate,3'-diphosphate pyrophosphatase
VKLAAIDIGSNAARLLISEVTKQPKQEPVFNKINLVRVPLRLGFDVFETGEISKPKVKMLMQTLKAYQHLLEAYEIKHVYACATSAMRDARNSKDIIRKVKLETGIEIKVISGQEEASLIYENHVAENLDSDHSYLYIDVGGGSTELTFFANGELVSKESFNIGTIRLLKNQIKEKAWDDMKDYVKKHIKSDLPSVAIGSGGNITKILSMSRLKEGKPLSLDLLKDYYKELSNVTIEDRMQLYGLKEDRADVIVPALLIYVQIMKWASIDAIYVPKIGLVDGLIHHLYDQVGNIALTYR